MEHVRGEQNFGNTSAEGRVAADILLMMSQCGLKGVGGRSLAGSHDVFLDPRSELLSVWVQTAGHLEQKKKNEVCLFFNNVFIVVF